MRAIWKGSISFGLVNIPIALFSATRKEDLKFHLLRKSDLSPVNYKRVAAADQKEVPWEEIVKGYEYEKGKYIVLKEEDFARVDIEATQTVDITDFVELKEVSPIYFYKPYYMEPQKGGDHAYALLRDALTHTGKIGIAKVVIKTRQYLASVKPQDEVLMLELMHFADELVEPDGLKLPSAKQHAGKRELEMAEALISGMTSKWEPDKYHDEYREALEKVIQEKIEHPDAKVKHAAPTKKATNVVDLVAVLQQSLAQHGKGEKPEKKKVPAKKPAHPARKLKKAA
jgi:DNA end-binding protein Ku